MPTPASLFDYHLPPERIAQASVEPRDHSRLMVLDRQTGEWQHKQFFEIVGELRKGDVLVLNKTKVFKARLFGKRAVKNKQIEIFLLRPTAEALAGSSVWETMARPGKLLHVGNVVEVAGVPVHVVEKRDDGTVLVRFDMETADVFALAEKHGEIPVPPYVKNTPTDSALYQTVYAQTSGSVAAPTAGFHFTERLLEDIKKKGVEIEFVTLHVGLGTFRPMKTETIEAHQMHAEYVEIDAATAERINAAKSEGRRVIAVGTTTVRALEGVAHSSPTSNFHLPTSFAGDVNMFITPGYKFKIIDGLITNFHLPKSTLLVLVSAFAGREHVLAAYEEAIKQGYRFYSFGDAMFIR